MMENRSMARMTRYSAAILVGAPWVLFLICYFLNPQWVLTRDALSSFGDPSFSKFPWVYNVGLGIIAIVIWVMSVGIVATSEKKMHVFGGAFWFVAGIFLALIGIYHGGTYPHDFVSTYFFVQAALAMVFMGIGSFTAQDFAGAVTPIGLAILMPLGDILIPFPSAATTEIFEIMLIDAWVLFSLFYATKAVPVVSLVGKSKGRANSMLESTTVWSMVAVFTLLLGLIIFLSW